MVRDGRGKVSEGHDPALPVELTMGWGGDRVVVLLLSPRSHQSQRTEKVPLFLSKRPWWREECPVGVAWVVLTVLRWCWLHCTRDEIPLSIIVSCLSFGMAIGLDPWWKICPVVLIEKVIRLLDLLPNGDLSWTEAKMMWNANLYEKNRIDK